MSDQNSRVVGPIPHSVGPGPAQRQMLLASSWSTKSRSHSVLPSQICGQAVTAQLKIGTSDGSSSGRVATHCWPVGGNGGLGGAKAGNITAILPQCTNSVDSG